MKRPLIRATTSNYVDLRHYLDGSRDEPLDAGLKEMSFGEFLVEKNAINRYQLFRGLQMQDRNPGVRFGECIAALGYLSYSEVEEHLEAWKRLTVFEA